jgi:mycothiol synthase
MARRCLPPKAGPTGGSPALHEPTADDAPGPPAGPLETIAVRGRVSADEARAVLGLVAAATAEDGVGPLSEQVLLHIRNGGDPGARNLLLWDAGELAGFAHLGWGDPAEGGSGELAVHPAHRGRGLGLALARALVAGSDGRPVLLWAHGDQPAAARLARAAGFTRVRALWRMQRSLLTPLAPPDLPDGVTVRTFAPGRDEARWLGLNSRAFASHPEQGRWTSADLDLREREPWFDPAGFFLAERGDHLAGFHWTKIHSSGPGNPVGEVYVIGVDPAERGTGLGRALTLTGLHYLRDRGMPEVMLYVDETNTAAIGLYASLGFTRAGTDVMYRHAA